MRPSRKGTWTKHLRRCLSPDRKQLKQRQPRTGLPREIGKTKLIMHAGSTVELQPNRGEIQLPNRKGSRWKMETQNPIKHDNSGYPWN